MSRKSKSVLPKARKKCVVCRGSGRSDDYHVASCELSKPGIMVFDSCCACVPKKCLGCGGTGNRERTSHRIAREVMES